MRIAKSRMHGVAHPVKQNKLKIHSAMAACLITSLTLHLPEALAVDRVYTKPNIIFIMADDLGYGDIGIYNPASKINMSNLTQLSLDGMTFTDAHPSAAVCAPTRYSAITGNYQWRGRYEWGSWVYHQESQILPGQLTVGDILQSVGYKTAFFGKLHLGGRYYMKDFDAFAAQESEIDFARQFRDGPIDHGFDYSYLIPAGVQGPPYAFFENDTMVGDPSTMIQWASGKYGNSEIGKNGIGVPSWDTTEIGEAMVTKVIEFIDGHLQNNTSSGSDDPFFVYFTPSAPHWPWTPPVSLLGTPVRGVTGLNNRSDMIYEFDVTVGKIMEAIEAQGIERNTLVIVSSDNGGEKKWEFTLGHDSTGGLRGEKGEIWEGGHRVPMIVRWGDGTLEGSVIQPGTSYNELIAVNDLAATVAALAGAALDTDQANDSYNFLSVLLGTTTQNTVIRDSMILEARRDIVTGDWTGLKLFALRQGPWKLIMDEAGNPLNLFNLDLDINETIDLINNNDQASRIVAMQSDFNVMRNESRTAPVLIIDADGDGLSDAQEYFLGTDKDISDTDGDGLSDYDEVNMDGDINNYSTSTDTDPLLTDTDSDGINDRIDPIPLIFNYTDGDLSPLGSPDGNINTADALIALRISLGIISPSSLEISHGDMNIDGVINLSDVFIIIKTVIIQ